MKFDWKKAANKVLQAKGFLVMVSPRKLRIGEIVMDVTSTPGKLTHQPFQVIGTSTIEEYREQVIAVGITQLNDYPDHYTYYRVVTE